MIPYFIAFFFLGIPLCWAEWAMGRMGGAHGHGSTPGMFHVLWKNPLSKHFGSLGLIITFGVCVYYIYLEAWTLGYAWFEMTGRFSGIATREEMGTFLTSFQGLKSSSYFDGMGTVYSFFLLSFAVNVYVLWYGIRGGIEKLCNIGLPLLFIMALVLVIRVFTLDSPDPMHPENSVVSGLGFVWNPDFSQLRNAKIWLAAAGQIFFTLSVGFGCIQTYASYLDRKKDVTLNGLTAAISNEVAEVVCGGSIAIPIAVAFFGIVAATEIAHGGSFNLGFQAMPLIFEKIPLGRFFGTLWFFLLFIAAITSSVSMVQPVVAFFQDEFGWSRKKAVVVMSTAWFLCAQPVIFFLGHGYLDEMDFWLGTLGVVVFALIETIVFIWIYGPNKAWEEINAGGDLKLPRFFLFVLKYVTPLYLIFILISWGKQDGIRILFMEGVSGEDIPYIMTSRIMMFMMFVVINALISVAFRRRARREREKVA